MEKEYKTKFDRFKIEVNDIFKSHLPSTAKMKKWKLNTDLVSWKLFQKFSKMKSVLVLEMLPLVLLSISKTDKIC